MKSIPKLEGTVTPVSSTDNSSSPAPKFGRSNTFLEDDSDPTMKKQDKAAKGKKKMKESVQTYTIQTEWVNNAKENNCVIKAKGNGLYEASFNDTLVGEWDTTKDSGWIRENIMETTTAGAVAATPMPFKETIRRGKGSVLSGIKEAVQGSTIKDIISMARQGMSDQDIAEKLGISVEQIQNILDHSIDDLEASDEYFDKQQYQDVPAQEQPAQTPPVAESRKPKKPATKKSTNENFDRENDKLWGEGNWKSLNEKNNSVAEGRGDKVHLKTPKHGLADHPGRNTGVGLRTFAQTPEQDRCPKCNSLFKNHYKQGVAEGEIEQQYGDTKPWAYWGYPNRVAKKLYQIHRGEPIDKSAIVQLWKQDGPDRMTKFMLKPDVSAILSAYEQMSNQGPLFKQGVAEGWETQKSFKVIYRNPKTGLEHTRNIISNDEEAVVSHFKSKGLEIVSIKYMGLADKIDDDRRLQYRDEDEDEDDQGVAEGLVGDVVVHNYTKMPIDLKPGQAQIHGWGPGEQPIYRVKGSDGKEVITSNKKKMIMIARGQGVAKGIDQLDEIGDTPAGREKLRHYVKTASDQVQAAQPRTKNSLEVDTDIAKRNVGSIKAYNRLSPKFKPSYYANEDVDQLDEIGDRLRVGKMKEKGVAEGSTKVDMVGKKCNACKKGTYQETKVDDDMRGTLHCTKCNKEVNRWQAPKQQGVAEGSEDEMVAVGTGYQKLHAELWQDLMNEDSEIINEVDLGLIANFVQVAPSIARFIMLNALEKAQTEERETAQMIEVMKKKINDEKVSQKETRVMRNQFKDLVTYALIGLAAGAVAGGPVGVGAFLLGAYKKELIDLVREKGPEFVIALFKQNGIDLVNKLIHSLFRKNYHLITGEPYPIKKPDKKSKTVTQPLDQTVTEPSPEVDQQPEIKKCPHCGGPLVIEGMINEKKDACYYKVKSRYKVWPSAYASGALVKCRKKGAKNWGNKSESVDYISEEDVTEEQLLAKELSKQYEIFKKGPDKELTGKPSDKEVQGKDKKPKDTELKKKDK